MSSNVQEAEIKELLGYLKNIESYEKEHLKSESSTIAMVWGIFVTIAGIIDLNLSLIIGLSPHFVPWFLCIFGAYLAQQIIASQPLLFEKLEPETSIRRQTSSWWEILLTFVLMGVTPFIANISIVLIIPYIGLVFGSINLWVLISNELSFSDNKLSYFLALSFWFSGAIILTGAYLISYDIFVKLSGFIFGIIVGSVSFLKGYKSRKLLDA